MKLNWKVIIYTLITLFVVYMAVVPLTFILLGGKSFAESKIYEISGIKFDLGKVKVSMTHPFAIFVKSDKLSVVNNDGSIPLNISNPKIKLNLIPLLYNRIEISKFSANDEKINLSLTKDKVFMIGDYPLKLKKQKNKLKLGELKLNLGAYNVSIDDKLNNERVFLKGKYLKNVVYKLNDRIEFSTDGVMTIGQKPNQYFADVGIDLPLDRFSNDRLRINADIKDFDLSFISDYVNVLTNGLISDLKGVLNITAKTTKKKFKHKNINLQFNSAGLEVVGPDSISKIVHHAPLEITVNVKAEPKKCIFNNTYLNGENIKVLFDGTLFSSGKRVPGMDFNLEFKPSSLTTAAALLPWLRNVPREMDFYKFKEYKIWGQGEGKLHFKGQGGRPEVFGDVKLSHVDAVQRGIVSPDGGKVNMHFLGKKMNIDVYVPIVNDQYVEVKGFAKIDGSRYSELDITSSESVNLSLAKIIVDPLHEMLKFKTGPVPVMKAKGYGNINLRSRGKKVDPHLWGNITFRDATAEFIQIHNLVLNNGAGEVIFDNRDITFKTTSGTINGKPTYISGKCNVFGDLDVIAETKNQNIPDMIKVINTSPEMRDVQRVVKPFTNPQGIGDLYLNIYGNAQDVTSIKFNEDIFAKGKITFHNASTLLKNTYVPFKNINGVVNFNKKDADYDITGNIRNSLLRVKGTAHDKDMDLVASTDKLKLIDILDMFHPDIDMPFKKEVGNIFVSFIGRYKGLADSDNFEYNKILADGKIISNKTSSSPIKVYNGDFNIKNGVLFAKNIHGDIKENPYKLSFSGTNIYDAMRIKDAEFNFKNFDISSLNEIKSSFDLSSDYKNIAENITDISGKIDINGYMKNGGIYTNTDLKNITFTYKPYDSVIKILSGNASIKGETLSLNKINTRLSSMPVYINGKITNILSSPNANMYMSGKFNQEFFDKFINAKTDYPVKLKGDANFTAKLLGVLNNLHAYTSLNVAENSSIYYMGATLSGAPSGVSTSEGISTNPVSIISDINIYPNKVKINSLDYNQTISSQNKRAFLQKQLSMSGIISLLKGNVLKFDNFRIKTFEPTDAKIFNVLLKKPTIKQGIFTTDLVLNGTSSAPKALGKLNITSVDIPLLDATIRDIDFDFQKDYIYLNSKGVILTNDISLLVKLINNPTPPYIVEDMKIKTDTLNLNIIANRFNDYDTDKLRNKNSSSLSLPLSPANIIVKNSQIAADTILIKKAQATDFNANINISDDGILHINNYTFNLANGRVSGDITTDLNNFVSQASMNISNADAQIIAENFFDLTGQMYGIVTGNLEASCKGLSGVECLNTLNGKGDFVVIDGKMPKLGSLEYLLKAANLVTGGIGAVSINGIIDLITPLKTGNFDKITGDVKVQNGVATDINVYSYGKELNMYLTGSYDLSTLVADMEVYGSLSKDFSTLMSKIGNASLNRLLNTIPGIYINEIKPESSSNMNKIPNFDPNNILRVFKAEILGDINGSNYVKSFKWIKH